MQRSAIDIERFNKNVTEVIERATKITKEPEERKRTK